MPRRLPVLLAVLLLFAQGFLAIARSGPALALTAPASGRPSAATGHLPPVSTRFGILVDAATGDILWARNPHTPRPPASLTKMLTALTVRASAPLTKRLTVTAGDERVQQYRLGLRPGQSLTVGQALAALLIISANDTALQLASSTAGSVARFDAAMNLESERLGLEDSSWHSPNGLDTPGHLSSAFDLAILARAVLRDGFLAHQVRQKQAVFTTADGVRHVLKSHSPFLGAYPGAIGIKTGLTAKAGHCLAAAATRDGRTLIAIVLDSPDPVRDATRLLDWTFRPGGRPGGVAASPASLPAYVTAASVADLLSGRAKRPAPAPQAATATGPVPTPHAAGVGTLLDRAERLPFLRGRPSGTVPIVGGTLLTSGLLLALSAAAGALRRRRRERRDSTRSTPRHAPASTEAAASRRGP